MIGGAVLRILERLTFERDRLEEPRAGTDLNEITYSSVNAIRCPVVQPWCVPTSVCPTVSPLPGCLAGACIENIDFAGLDRRNTLCLAKAHR
ncbi:MAG: hypothetical protein E5W38_07170 [Mesorhizobium sp.]|uniref:hypothetical protein n=1 Tax=Mesorhizobium sp. TaxID=1871066 RepID=UPI000FE7FD7A|nr:hypothetical protein [Mesorhizobium sp.]RWA79575.1 MAG: hypothetical protein EOQ31_33615 [Mesorhizobium sp.]TIU34044.1 MAG: hypothetical protein E5W38_07170 [Mesorhizobium sp.]